MSVIDWGDVPTWLGTSFAALAAGAAVWTLKSQRDQIGEQRQFIAEQSATLELERTELRAAADERRVAQARKIYMDGRLSQVGTEGAARREVVVVNRSDAPVRDLSVRFGDVYVASEVFEMLPRTSALDFQMGERRMEPLHLLGPGRGAIFCSQAWPEASAYNNRPSLTFTDDNGVRWSLDSHGKLEEVPPQP